MRPLVVDGLTKHFGGVTAVDDVHLELRPGERRTIVGPNGAGKTTLFNLITGTVHASWDVLRFLAKIFPMPRFISGVASVWLERFKLLACSLASIAWRMPF